MTLAKKKAVLRAWRNNDWSFGVIAEHFDLTRNQVAGLVFRDNHPPKTRISSPNSRSPNKIGRGYRSGPASAKNLHSRCGRRAEQVTA